ncbi:DUF1638 domain-containing protein [Methanolobus sp. ZRKC3]|uniref:DUF1638 domain-containing protein n=1 Tax=Methanolobus sp. ZRKC3 TaxID=3125786 RepID=UPI00324FFD5F
MTVMTILSCRILQDEILHLLENDRSVDQIIVVKGNEENEFLVKLDSLGLEYTNAELDDVPTVSKREAKDKFIVLIYFMELALHEFPKQLKSGVYDKITELTAYSDGILLFYGLCGNVLGKVEEEFMSQEKTCPVRILKEGGRVVDDCIGATLGGTAEYLKALKQFSDKGTFFFTPMYAHSWRKIMRVDSGGGQTIEMLQEMNRLTGYNRVAKIQTGLPYTTGFNETVDEFAKIFDFEILEIPGNQEIFEKCYNSMKETMGIR